MADKLARLLSRRGPAVVVMVALLTLASACGKKSGSNSSTSGGNAFGAKESSTIAAEVPSSVKSKGSVTVAVDASYAPNEFFAADNKTIEGWDIDLGHALGTVMGVDFKFEPNTLTVPAGKPTEIVFDNKGTNPHTFTLEGGQSFELKADPGGTQSGTLPALKPGTYQFICSIPGHEQLGMKGTLTVR